MEYQRTPKGNSYWEQTGHFQTEYNSLYDKLVPIEGKCETLNGELIRASSRLLFEYYNNGNENSCFYSYCCIDEDEDDVCTTVDEYYQNFIDLIKYSIPESLGVLDNIISVIESERSSADDIYTELMDIVMYYVLTNDDKPIPDFYKNDEIKFF